MRPRRSCWSLAGIVLLAIGCAGPRAAGPGGGVASVAQPYHPDRRDYASFREAYPGLLEPNYLPFMVHRFARGTAQGDALILCRWSADQMPIRVYVNTPEIDASVRDEFVPVDPASYVHATHEALEVWERDLEGLVTFRIVESPERADLWIRLRGERGPVLDGSRRRLGAAEALADACLSLGWEPDADRMRIRFELPDLVVFLADEAGLLPVTIVRRLVAHEIGHALGMHGHSPSPGDLMFRELSDAPGADELSLQDVNSFLSLYQLPPGAHFGDAPIGDPPPRPPPAPPAGGPRVFTSPYVDPIHGFEIRVPASWVRIEEPHGVFFSDGPSWDHDASLRLFVWPSPTIERFIDCCSRDLLARGWFRRSAWIVVAGRRTLQVWLEDDAGERVQELLFIELGDGRVMLVAAESPLGYEEEWRPWFQAFLRTLDIWEEPARPRPGRRGAVPGRLPSKGR